MLRKCIGAGSVTVDAWWMAGHGWGGGGGGGTNRLKWLRFPWFPPVWCDITEGHLSIPFFVDSVGFCAGSTSPCVEFSCAGSYSTNIINEIKERNNSIPFVSQFLGCGFRYIFLSHQFFSQLPDVLDWYSFYLIVRDLRDHHHHHLQRTHQKKNKHLRLASPFGGSAVVAWQTTRAVIPKAVYKAETS